MQEKLRGIILRTVKYGDNSLILDMYTDIYGRRSFVTKIARVRHKVSNTAFWTPLNLVEFNADIRPGARLPQPKDVRMYHNYADIPFSPIKQTAIQFLAEFLSAALHEENENKALYAFIETAMRWFDATSTSTSPTAVANFHLVFMMRMSRFLGIEPNMGNASILIGTSNIQRTHIYNKYFDLQAGTFREGQPPHPYYLRPEEARRLPALFAMDFSNMHRIHLNRQARNRILTVLNDYYRLHLPNFPELKSIRILQEVFG